MLAAVLALLVAAPLAPAAQPFVGNYRTQQMVPSGSRRAQRVKLRGRQ